MAPTQYRPGIGIVLVNRWGLVFAGRRKDGRKPPWQMPQGGIQDGETAEQALWRELAEELGPVRAEILDIHPRLLSYDYPQGWGTPRSRQFRGQRQQWYLLRLTGSEDEIDLATQKPEFSQWRWMPPIEVAARVIAFKYRVYLDVFDAFDPAIRSLADVAPPLSWPLPGYAAGRMLDNPWIAGWTSPLPGRKIGNG